VYFFASDSVDVSTPYRYGLWKSDGTAAGTIHVKDFDQPYSRDVGLNSNGVLFFDITFPSSYGHEIWKSDGTEAGPCR